MNSKKIIELKKNKTPNLNSDETILPVRLDEVDYPIIIGSNLGGISKWIEKFTNSKQVFILCDSFFKDTYCSQVETELKNAGFEVITLFIEGGKTNKTIYTALDLLDNLETNEFTRDSTMIALGGGVVGDVGGFASATFMRGMNLVHIPTTFTAQVDSSVGGKVGVNHNQTINAIGTYHHPRTILIDIKFLQNLPEREFKSGMGEVIKSAIIKDREFCQFLLENSQAIMNRDPAMLLGIVKRTVLIKLAHVQNDVREKGIRLHLNYGHTIGQSIEMSVGRKTEVYRHGEAVCLGMMAAAHLADNYYNDGLNRVEFHRELLNTYHLPLFIKTDLISVNANIIQRLIYENIKKDKKRVAAGTRFVLIPEPGSAETVTGIEKIPIQAAIKSLFP